MRVHEQVFSCELRLEPPRWTPDDEYEDGLGGCLEDLNPLYISSDPNQDNVDYNEDNYDPFSNPEGTELNCKWDSGENFDDDNFNQSWDRYDTHFEYQPNPGFRCVDQIKFKVIELLI